MVDVDGVVIVHPDECGWIANLERDLGISASALQSAFFARHWKDISHGRAALRERLAPVLHELNPAISCERLIRYWFSNDAHLDEALLAQLAAIRAGGLEIHLATVQEHERAHYLWKDLDLQSRFDGFHYAAELGCAKPDASFYEAVERRTGYAPRDLLLLDDAVENVEAARDRGWAAALWTGDTCLRTVIAAHS